MNFQGAKVPGAPGKLAKVALLGGAALYAVANSFYNVEGGHRAIVFNRREGIRDKVTSTPSTRLASSTTGCLARECDFYLLCAAQVYPEGTHLMIPWFERPIIYDVRARPNLVESTSGSRDLQMVIFCFSGPRD